MLRLVFVLLLSPLGFAESFAALTVTPFGQQQFDIATGISTLAAGGQIIDKETNLKLEASFVRYLEGGFIEATGSTVMGKFGTLTAESLYVDVAAQSISASGELHFLYSNLNLTANALNIYLTPDVAVLEGNVQSANPNFSVNKLVIYLKTQQALLVSPYVYQNGPLTLQQDAAGELLQLLPEGSGESLSYNASTIISEEILAVLGSFLSP
jgi:hypothetical protein